MMDDVLTSLLECDGMLECVYDGDDSVLEFGMCGWGIRRQATLQHAIRQPTYNNTDTSIHYTSHIHTTSWMTDHNTSIQQQLDTNINIQQQHKTFTTAAQLANINVNNKKQSLGPKRRFTSPKQDDDQHIVKNGLKAALKKTEQEQDDPKLEDIPEALRNLDPVLIETIQNEIIDRSPKVSWDDIAGLDFVKKSVMEIVVWPMLRPDIFKGLRGPPRGILLFGPPGTGKTMIGKAIASEAKATFFSISASSLTSKWHGESEKLVRTLFAVASTQQPAVIFIDEIDSLLSQRSDQEQEISRRIKTEFLVQLDGAKTSVEERILVVGATNRPHELDEAARRRLVKKLYVPLPDSAGRRALLKRLVMKEDHELTEEQFDILTEKVDGYSGADLRALCTEAAFGPIRDLSRTTSDIHSVDANKVRPIRFADFEAAMSQVRPSVSQDDLSQYVEWNKRYGSFSIA